MRIYPHIGSFHVGGLDLDSNLFGLGLDSDSNLFGLGLVLDSTKVDLTTALVQEALKKHQ